MVHEPYTYKTCHNMNKICHNKENGSYLQHDNIQWVKKTVHNKENGSYLQLNYG